MSEVRYRGGGNVAMKLPPHHFDGAVKFYRDTLGLKVSDHGDSKLVEFGPIRLWLDRCPQFSQTELWLEVVASNSDERPSTWARPRSCGAIRSRNCRRGSAASGSRAQRTSSTSSRKAVNR